MSLLDHVVEDDKIYNIIQRFTIEEKKNWRQLLLSANKFEIAARRKYSWVWPTEKELILLKELFHELNITQLLSIGCGNGLLEWILKESLGIAVYGLEVDKAWWKSRYSVNNFISVSFIEDLTAENSNILQKCCFANDWKFALLFCYFNNHEAFLNYIKLYEGNWIIIIGPLPSLSEVYTDPMPFDLRDYPGFKIFNEIPIGINDVAVIYKKK